MIAILVFLIAVASTHCTSSRSALTSHTCAELSEACNTNTSCCSGMVCANVTTNGTLTSNHCDLELSVRFIKLNIRGAKNLDLNLNTDSEVKLDIDTLSNDGGKGKNCKGKKGKNCKKRRKNRRKKQKKSQENQTSQNSTNPSN
uniref:WAP domain-containing protein n=1 Tax=Graphocephala atropunctata TaxID=36148 RepID=A0A1B6KKT5_9HEMI